MSKFATLFAKQIGYSKCTMKERQAKHTAVKDDVVYAVDANILLDLYSLGKETADAAISILNRLAQSKKLFIPYQASIEFLKNRVTTIEDSHKSMGKKITDMDNKSKELKPDKENHPIAEQLKTLTESIQKVIADYKVHNDNINIWKHDIEKDEYVGFLKSLPDECIGDAYKEDVLAKIIADGLVRLNCKIPPGLEDHDKETLVKCGDYIIFRELIDYGKAKKCNIILVTRDMKHDWWCYLDPEKPKSSGGDHARHEMMDEYETETKGKLYNNMTFAKFLELKNAPAQAVKEVKQLSESDRNRFSEMLGRPDAKEARRLVASIRELERVLRMAGNNPAEMILPDSAEDMNLTFMLLLEDIDTLFRKCRIISSGFRQMYRDCLDECGYFQNDHDHTALSTTRIRNHIGYLRHHLPLLWTHVSTLQTVIQGGDEEE